MRAIVWALTFWNRNPFPWKTFHHSSRNSFSFPSSVESRRTILNLSTPSRRRKWNAIETLHNYRLFCPFSFNLCPANFPLVIHNLLCTRRLETTILLQVHSVTNEMKRIEGQHRHVAPCNNISYGWSLCGWLFLGDRVLEWEWKEELGNHLLLNDKVPRWLWWCGREYLLERLNKSHDEMIGW